MKTILLPVESNTTIDAAFAVADLVGRAFGSRVDAVAVKPSVVDFIAPDPVVVVLPQPAQSEAEAERAARGMFDKFNAGRAKNGSDGCTFRWSERGPVDDAAIASLSRVYDLTIVGRPGLGRSEPRMTTLEAALFESGRPIIMAPPSPPRTLGTNVLIHWNASTETARTIHDAMPLLRKAEQVTLVTVEGNMVPGPKAADMIDYLAAHGIRATETKAKPVPRGSMSRSPVTACTAGSPST